MIDRISKFIENQGISVSAFEKSIHASDGMLRRAIKNGTDIQSKWITAISDNYPKLNIEWLITGKGEMIITSYNNKNEINESIPTYTKSDEKGKGIPLIPVECMAGNAKGDICVMDNDIIDSYVVPEFKSKGVEFLIRVSGASMYPKYSNGDLLACRPVKDLSFFQWGKVYVLDTEQGALVKRLFPCNDDKECLECRSDNSGNYPPFQIRKSSVRSVAIVVGVIRLE